MDKKELSSFFEFKSDADKQSITDEPLGDTIGREKSWEDSWLKVKEANLLELGTTVSNPYQQSAWVYRAVSVIATNVPQAPFTIYRGKEKLEKLDISNPVVQLFENPNPFQSSFEFWESIASYLNLYGEAFIYLNASVGQLIGTRNLPAELWSLNPKLVKHAFADGQLAGWEYGGLPIEPDELIHFKFFNPSYSTIRGQSPIEAVRNEMEADYQATKFNKAFFENDATPNGVIEVDKDKQIDIKELRKLKKMWNENHQGSGNAHKTAFLLGGMTYRQMSLSQKDMEWIEGRKFSRDAIYSVFGVSPFVAGHYDSGTVTRATAKEATRLFWTNTLIPQLLRMELKLNSKFFMRLLGEGYWCKFDTSGIEELKTDYNESVITAKDLFTLGYTRNEINQRLELGMPDDDQDGDVRYLPQNLVPVDMDEGGVPQKSVPTEKGKIDKNKFQRRYLRIQGAMEKKMESKLKRVFFDMRKEILSYINSQEKALTAEQEAELLAFIRSVFENNEIQTKIEPIARESLQQAGEMALDNLGIKRPFIVNETILNARLNFIKGASDTLFEQIRSTVYENIKEGQNIPTIADGIKEVFNVSTNRAKVIARTETASLMTAQTEDVYKSEGITKKQWITTIDDATRESHIRVNGEIVGINDTFSNGLKYPGDLDAPAKEVVNCRCALAPVVE